jgi:DNA-binding MarR family transcriptional regulator
MAGLDRQLQAPARLELMAIMSAASEVEFAVLRERLDLSDSVLSKHVSTLVDAGYARSRKGSQDGRRTTWISSTAVGREALADHVAALRAIIDQVGVLNEAR